MTPERMQQATQLDATHRRLLLEIKQWQAMHESPIELGSAIATQVPATLWLALKNGMVAHLQELVAKNREAFEKL